MIQGLNGSIVNRRKLPLPAAALAQAGEAEVGGVADGARIFSGLTATVGSPASRRW
jgi:hypothetical protein